MSKRAYELKTEVIVMKRFTAILAALLAASCVFSSAVMAIPGETDPQTGYNQYVQDNIRYDALGYAYIDDEDGTRIYYDLNSYGYFVPIIIHMKNQAKSQALNQVLKNRVKSQALNQVL